MPETGKDGNMINNEVQNLQCSSLIVNPVKRKEIWRFVTYMFLHANLQHIVFNLLMQLVIGKSYGIFKSTSSLIIKRYIVYKKICTYDECYF